jgi:hypothetical protein
MNNNEQPIATVKLKGTELLSVDSWLVLALGAGLICSRESSRFVFSLLEPSEFPGLYAPLWPGGGGDGGIGGWGGKIFLKFVISL